MKKLNLKKVLILSALVAACTTQNANAQLIVGAAPSSLNPNAMLQVQSSNKGVLFPNVALTSTLTASPLTAHVAGMVVYNTATANDVTPGLYQNNGVRWSKLIGGGSAIPAGNTNVVTLEVGQTYNYATAMLPTAALDLDGSANPKTGGTNYAPVIDGLMVSLTNGTNDYYGVYQPYIKNTTAATVNMKYIAQSSSTNIYYVATSTALTSNTKLNMEYDNSVYGGNYTSDILKAVIFFNDKWYEIRIISFGAVSNATADALTERNVSISITRIG